MPKPFWIVFLSIFFLMTTKIGPAFVGHMVLVGLLILLIINRLMYSNFTIPLLFSLSLLMLSAIVVMSLLKSNDDRAVFAISRMYLFYTGMFFTYYAISDFNDLEKLFKAILIGCLSNALVGLYQSLSWIIDNGLVLVANNEFFRVKGICTSPSDYISLLSIGLVLSLTVLTSKYRKILINLFIILLLISMSRIAIVLLILLAIGYIIYIKLNLQKLFYITCISLIVVPMLMYFGDAITERMMDILNINYNIKRIVLYDDLFDKITSSYLAFTTGHGFGVYSFYHPIDLVEYRNPHNVILDIFYSIGFVGLLVIMVPLSVLFIKIYKLHGNYKGSIIGTYAGGVLMIYLLFLVIAMVDSPLTNVSSGWLYGVLFGVGLLRVRIFSHLPVSTIKTPS